mmetsp:Transcript_39310/g.64313  ORF Transcript_39310/g.64313 Transcript_39310/m.64313 type:complete len:267 (-) Transcript_39310:9-809(-)
MTSFGSCAKDESKENSRFPTNHNSKKKVESKANSRFPTNNNNSKKRVSKYRNVNEEKRFIFIHVPKTGGSSIERMFFNRCLDSEHKCLKDYMRCYRYRQFYTFAFVRNPYLRAISMYIYFKSGGNQKHDRWKICTLFAKFAGLDDFVRYYANTDNTWFTKHEFFENFCQTDYVFDGNRGVDFIGKLEHFEHDMQRLMKVLKITDISKILHENYNGNKHKFDALVVTPMFVEFINDHASADFEAFGYKKLHLNKSIPLKTFKLLCNN